MTGQGKVIYKTGDNRLGRFPEAASEDLLAGPKRNFQVFDPLSCPNCGGEMKVISFIERNQSEVILLRPDGLRRTGREDSPIPLCACASG